VSKKSRLSRLPRFVAKCTNIKRTSKVGPGGPAAEEKDLHQGLQEELKTQSTINQ
jgi:hypothetical protein